MKLDGVLFFPVTPFDDGGDVDLGTLRTHVGRGLGHAPGAVFAACGTGEFHALDADEHAAVVRAVAEAVSGQVPVFAGVGGSLPTARRQARAAKSAGADGLLLLPPYLVRGPARGLVDYVREVASASDLPLVLYNRANATLTPEAAVEAAALPQVVGLKDGVGDLDLMQRIVLAVRAEVGDDFLFFNGLPTAEFTVPAYRSIGVPLYSSAAFAMVPAVAATFHQAIEDANQELIDRLTARFYLPLVELRDRVPGYAVSLIKAGVGLSGLRVGGVRPPLVDPTEADLADLSALLGTARGLVDDG